MIAKGHVDLSAAQKARGYPGKAVGGTVLPSIKKKKVNTFVLAF